jgi:hypothetical protein
MNWAYAILFSLFSAAVAPTNITDMNVKDAMMLPIAVEGAFVTGRA